MGPGVFPRWGFLSIYPASAQTAAGNDTRSVAVTARPHRAIGATNNNNAAGGSSGLSHQLSQKLTRMSASVFRMASTAVSSPSSSGPIPTEVSAAYKSSMSHWSFNLAEDSMGMCVGDGYMGIATRIPFDLPLITKRSTAVSTLRVSNVMLLVVSS